MKRVRLLGVVCACMLQFVFCPPAQAATVQYNYIGNMFNDNSTDQNRLCTAGDSGCFNNITATIELSTELAGGLILGMDSIIPITWSISDGLTTITNQILGFNYNLSFGTSTSGTITGWSFFAYTTPQALDEFSSMRTTSSTDDTRYCNTFTTTCTSTALALTNNTGSWTLVTPIPAAVWLFGSGLLGMLGFCRRS